MPDAAPDSAPRIHAGCLKWPSIAAVVIVCIICLTLLKSCDRLQRLADTIIGGFTKNDITQVFRENLIKVTATDGDILEVATLDMEETLKRYDTKSIAWNLINIGTTVSEIRVPAVFRYHVKLSDDWQVSVENDTAIVVAPVLRPSLPPAIHTDKMEKKSEAGWGRFNADDNLSALEKSITPSLQTRAGQPSHIDKVRGPARKAVAEFVKKWVVGRDADARPKVKRIIILFADEPEAKNPHTATKQPATLDVLP